MAIQPGDAFPLMIDKPAAGGRMIARANGQVVLVAGAIPGERVTARIERTGKGVLYADVTSVLEPSPDRREPFTDPMCGGCLYAHISYPRQLAIKSDVIRDAFGRIGRITLPEPVHVASSPDEGYRMRARLHVRNGRTGFFREGTHEVCDARATRQLLPATCDVLDRVAASLQPLGAELRELEVAESVDASQRVVHLDASEHLKGPTLEALGGTTGLTGLTASDSSAASRQQIVVVAGDPHVTDLLTIEGHEIRLRRHALAFFQGNRYLLESLAAHVVAQVGRGSRVIDLYAGGGLFSVASAIVREARVVAVEGDRIAAADLAVNAKSAARDTVAVQLSVEAFLAGKLPKADVVILDPPRTGLSKEALRGALNVRAATLVYVSCDVATLARDARGLLDGGYRLRRIDAFDLFPNTPHVECVVVFES